ncbi:MAG: hypothetical protein WD690_10625, partial [Vicinamibacterales bacterium]
RSTVSTGSMSSVQSSTGSGSTGSLPRVAAKPDAGGIGAAQLSSRIDAFLAGRGIRPRDGAAEDKSPDHQITRSPNPVDFVCEADVREAMSQKRKIVVGEKTIVTPAARDLGEAHKVFVQASWRS